MADDLLIAYPKQLLSDLVPMIRALQIAARTL
jgi:hypothetical protein